MVNAQLRQQLSTALNKHLKSAIASALGYKITSEGFIDRLNHALSDDLLGLDAGGYDFKHSDESFLRALCELAEIDATLIDDGIAAAYKRAEHRKHAFRPSLFVDTGFKRKTEPVFVLAMSEGLRRLTWPLNFVDLTIPEQLKTAQERAKEHFNEANGELTVWGPINRYIFNYGIDLAVVITADGVVRSDQNGFKPDHGIVSLNGSEITSLVNENIL